MIKNKPCTPETKVEIKFNSCAIRCKYHGKGRKNKYNFHGLAPKNLCPDLFYVAYPYGLAFLYDAVIDKKRSVILSCPYAKANVKLEVRAKPMRLKPLLNRIEKWARKNWRPLSLTDKRIIMKIISVEGDCPRHHQSNQEFEFNIGFSSELCPASFHSIYPFIFLIAKKELSRFADTRHSIKIGCPDARDKIIYKIKTKF